MLSIHPTQKGKQNQNQEVFHGSIFTKDRDYVFPKLSYFINTEYGLMKTESQTKSYFFNQTLSKAYLTSISKRKVKTTKSKLKERSFILNLKRIINKINRETSTIKSNATCSAEGVIVLLHKKIKPTLILKTLKKGSRKILNMEVRKRYFKI